jgi:hypothetical protein
VLVSETSVASAAIAMKQAAVRRILIASPIIVVFPLDISRCGK